MILRRGVVSILLLVSLVGAVGFQKKPAPTPQQRGLLYADLWVQTSAEYAACCRQTYRYAGDVVARELARIVAGESKLAPEFRGLPPAVILDLDETVLDNGTYQSFLYDSGQDHSAELFSRFVVENKASIRLVPGAKDFIARAHKAGATVIFITNRAEEIRAGTIETLAQWGIDTTGLADPKSLRLLMKRGESSKTSRRDQVRAKYRILALVGDQLGDFSDEFEAVDDNTIAARLETVEEYDQEFGRRWFMLPNPVYGDWTYVLRGDAEEHLRRAGTQPDR